MNKLIYPDKEFYKVVALVMVPIAFQNMITIAVNVTDTMMLGSLGEIQLSASSLAGQYINFFQTLCMGTSMGASVLTARYWGMKNIRSLHVVMTIMFRITIVISVFFSLSCFFFSEIIMRMYTSEQEIVQQGQLYLGFAVPAFIFQGLSLSSTIILRSIKKVRLALFVSVGAFILNIFGNYVFIFGKLGFKEMGIAGASLSTLIVRVFECAVNFGYIVFVEKDVHYRLNKLLIKTKILIPEYIKISVPVLVSDGMNALGNNTIMVIIGHLGSNFIAANAIVAVVDRLCTAWSSGISQSSAMFTGISLGEANVRQAKEQGNAFLGLGIAFGIAGGIAVLFLSTPIFFLYHLSGKTAFITQSLLYASSIIIAFQSVGNIMTKGVLRGGGDTRMLMVMDSFFLWVVSIPLGYLFGLKLGMAPFLIYLALKSDNICKSIWSVFRLSSGKWIKKIKAIE